MENTLNSLKFPVCLAAGLLFWTSCGQQEVRDLQTRQDEMTNSLDRDRDELRQELLSLRRDIDEQLIEAGTKFNASVSPSRSELEVELQELEGQRRKVQDALNLLDVVVDADQAMIHDHCRSVAKQVDGWFDWKAELEDMARFGMAPAGSI
jgi:chromosome segregation ATPase